MPAVSQEIIEAVTPAQAGVQKFLDPLDSRLRGNDGKERFRTFYEFISYKRNILGYQSPNYFVWPLVGFAASALDRTDQ